MRKKTKWLAVVLCLSLFGAMALGSGSSLDDEQEDSVVGTPQGGNGMECHRCMQNGTAQGVLLQQRRYGELGKCVDTITHSLSMQNKKTYTSMHISGDYKVGGKRHKRIKPESARTGRLNLQKKNMWSKV